MSWIQELYDTSIAVDKLNLKDKPCPICHMDKVAHIEITLKENGEFKKAEILEWENMTRPIPVTEESANRTRNVAPHPLCEELSYCAKDLPDADPKRYEKMKNLMERWLAFDEHPKVRAIYTYLEKGELYTKLNAEGFFPFSTKNRDGKKTPVAVNKVFIRWKVRSTVNVQHSTWEDESLIQSWIAFDTSQKDYAGFCMVTGKQERIAKIHPRFLRTSSDGAKLISSNDNEDFTFRGRFTDKERDYGKQTCTVGYIASQKAHNILRWLMHRQGRRFIVDGEVGRCFVAWAISGTKIPAPEKNTKDIVRDSDVPDASVQEDTFIIRKDVGESFVERLNSYITGYNAHIEDKKDDIVIMGVDSAVPGRMAITYYRKLEKSEYLDRIKAWHINFAWYQNYNTDLSKQHKRLRFVGAPAPEDIAWAAYCTDRIKIPDKLDKDLLGTTVERILPCIIDGQQFPLDLVQSVINRVSNRTGLKPAEWEKCLGIACALYKGYYKEKEMSLDENRDDRDYLYGRLLAVAEEIESFALRIADEHRLTNAERLMQRFSDSPFSTWKTIRESLEPYIRRINASKYRGRLIGYKELLDEIKALFKYDEYKSNERLSGLYLLGYHCQRRWLRIHKRKDGKWILKPSDNIAPKNTEGTNGNTQQEN